MDFSSFSDFVDEFVKWLVATGRRQRTIDEYVMTVLMFAKAKRSITKDPETRDRIEKAFNAFRADVLRKQIEKLESGKGQFGM